MNSWFSWKNIIQFLLGIAVSAGILVWLTQSLIQSTGHFEWGDLAAIIKGIPMWVLVVALLCQLLQTWFRTMRYRLLLQIGEEKPDFGKLLLITFVRNMFVDLLPSRAGEISYLVLLKRVLGERVAKGIASMGASFAFDLIALLILITVVLTANVAIASGGWHLPLLIPVSLIVVIAYYVFFHGFSLCMQWTIKLRLKLFSRGLLQKLNGIAEETDESISMIRGQRNLGRVFFLSMGIRIFKYSGMLLLLYVVLNSSFLALGLEKLGSLLIGVVMGEASASLPVPSFMSFGTYEAGASITLQHLGYSLQASIISMFIVHLISQSMDYSLGIAALCISWVMGWFATGTEAQGKEDTRLFRRVIAGCVFLFLVGLIVLAYMWRSTGSASHSQNPNLEPEPMEPAVVVQSVQESENPVVENPVSNDEPALQGFAVWASNRFGNHEIVQLDLESKALKRLTHTDAKEYYPGISPDGSKLIFARASQPDWSIRKLKGWSIVMLDLETLEEVIVSPEGYEPSWAGDDSHIVFTRLGKQIVLKDIETGIEQILVEAGKNGVPSGFDFQTPYYNPKEGSVAVTVRGSRRTKFIYKPNGQPSVELPEGCQLAWMPDYRKLIFTGHGKIRENAFSIVDPETGVITGLLDVPGAYSHEYFPRVSRDGKWLIFGASAEGHVHDRADYEIFLWEIGTPTDQIERLSNDPGNDSWPDIFIKP